MRRSSRRATTARAGTAIRTDTAAALELLATGSLELVGRLADASNATFLGQVKRPLAEPRYLAADAPSTHLVRCVYKPVRGERPLDDFPDGTLAARERAAYLVSEALGWDIVPPTVLRDGPFGWGAVQLWIDADPAQDVVEMALAPDPRLRRVCVFDTLVNNADRKGSHLLPLPDGHVYAVDHGVCFHEQPKLRTVLWAWRGRPLSDDELAAVERVAADLGTGLGDALGDLLTPSEVVATRRRATALLRARRFPQPNPSRPALPWPPF